MSHVTFLKLGGSAITDKASEATPRLNVIRALAQAIRQARAQHPTLPLVLGHGSGSFGHFAAKKWGFGQPDNWRAFAETGASAQRLNRIVADIFLEHAVPIVSFQPSASIQLRDGEIEALDTANLVTALAHNLIPLIYGDVAFDATRGMSIVSTDALFGFLTSILKPSRIIYATAVDGVYTADPRQHPDAQPIREITPATFEQIRAGVGAAHGADVTGGMLDKVRRSLALVTHFPGLDVYIVTAGSAALLPLLLGQAPRAGTHIHA